jgi:hypothetical protein
MRHVQHYFTERRAILSVVFIGLLLLSGLLWQPMTGHSMTLNENWHEGFFTAFRSGDIYPRWITTTNQGLGAPTFYFYAPLPFWMSSLIDLVWPFAHGAAFPPAGSAVVALILSGCGMYALMRCLYSTQVGVISGAVYMAMPYHLGVDLWWRAALGEIWGFVWLPLIVLGIVRQARGLTWGREILCLASAGLILSHLPSFMIGCCGLAGIAVFWPMLTRQWKASLPVLLHSSAAVVIALIVTAGYWYPAVTTLDYTDINQLMLNDWYSYKNNFIFPYVQNSWNGLIQRLAFLMFVFYLLLVLLAIKLGCHKSTIFRLAALSGFLSFIMMMNMMQPVWGFLVPLQRIQFPWRFLMLMDFSLVVMLGHAIFNAKPLKLTFRLFVPVSIVIGSFYAFALKPTYSASEAKEHDQWRLAKADAYEYRTKWTDGSYYWDIAHDTVHPAKQTQSINHRLQLTARSDGRRYTGVLKDPSVLPLAQFYYPGLRAINQKSGQRLVVRAQHKTGLAVVVATAGVYDIVIDTEMLPQEITGWRISLFGLVLAVFLILRRKRYTAPFR